jgi:two-component system sensor histidine kinase/response regulator
MFAREQPRAADEIRAALMAGQHDVAVRLAHTLKGIAGTVGAKHIEITAAAVEAALTQDAPTSDLECLLETLASHLNEMIGQLKLRLPAA